MENVGKNILVKKTKIALELLIFIVGTAWILQTLTGIVSPKYLFNTSYSSPETEMWEGFDALPKNSLDILYVGSSHFYNGINPVVIYNQTGYTGYDMTCSGQDMGTAYFLMKYALKTQKPQVIVLDAYSFFYDCFVNDAIFSKSVDGMKLSKVKMEAIRDWQQIYPEFRTDYRLFPILDYHTRWEELTEYDFLYEDLKDSWVGFAPSYHYETVEHNWYYEGFDYQLPTSNTMMSYFSKIVDLCNENGIRLVLLEMPCQMWNAYLNDTVGIIAETYGVEYWDYNPPEVFDSIGLDMDRSFRDPNHLNMHGGVIFSGKLAEKLLTLELKHGQNEFVISSWDKLVLEWDAHYEEKLAEMFTPE